MAIPPAARELTRRRVLRYFAIGLAVDATVIASFATHPQWLEYFYSERFPLITTLIFAVFFLGLGVTYVNFVRLVWEEHALIRAVQNLLGTGEGRPTVSALLEGVRSSFVSLRIADMAEATAEGLRPSADTASDEVAAREEIHSGLAKYVTAILTMLGLVGTFLGLIIAIDGISEISNIENREAFIQGVKAALDGMGTAFSTSLAGIFGAVVLGFEQLMFHFAQVSYLSRLDRFSERYLEPCLGPATEVDVEDVLPGAGEIAAFTEAFRAWRGELERVQGDLSDGVSALVKSQGDLSSAVKDLAGSVGGEQQRLAELEEKLDELRWYVGRENATLLGLVGHVAAEEEGREALEGELPPDAGDADTAEELRRTNQLLGRIYGELGMAVRSATFKLEEGQTALNRNLARLIQRMESTAGTSAEQVHMLRTILGHVGKDEERLTGLLETLKRENRGGTGE
jgi:biopolymer transport protein ExbB/TolQ